MTNILPNAHFYYTNDVFVNSYTGIYLKQHGEI